MSKYELEGVCYVLVQTNTIHPIAHDRFDFLWYPERGMSLIDQMKYRPYVQSIVTECPWIIAMYDMDNIRVWDAERGWVRPSRQTYGAEVSGILHEVMGFNCHIPAQVMDGAVALDKQIDELEKSYEVQI